ncbi:hypothetical protein ACFQFC_15960 [Amorphoplanes digitatis]|uniref:Uncharacterized protein n=1 Tax=Actinoplanes digitatis TaxID=1868 RepID=A0A7W7I3Q2_9ACTN|nr:hypothetical protein [Actinoplanes digitatis]MBB4765706.1 hypothetical protein [Actinoplanes digitatis]GID98043.1 hypothetical protein Adi01nite_74550 [Actinoplanes digitatis]
MAGVALSAGLAAAPGWAAPHPLADSAVTAPKAQAKPTAVQIAGDFPGQKIIVQQAERDDLFNRLLSEVNWLASTPPTTSRPKADKMGPKFVVTVLAKDKPTQVYDLYPNAAGGPRAYRPAKQPTGKKSAGWFYGRLTMSESLRLSGVPLKAKPDVVSGGIGGGIGEDVEAADEMDAVENVNHVLADFRRLVLLNTAVLVVILLGLAGIAYLIRRRV